MRPPSSLKGGNYKAWTMKLKGALKFLDRWRMVNGDEAAPPSTPAAGATAAERAAVVAAITAWNKKWDKAAAILVSSLSDEESHVVQSVDDDPVQIWAMLKEKLERKSEAEAESAQMQLLDFAHKVSETANALIELFDAATKYCTDQGVVLDENHMKRMLLARPADRYVSLKQSYLLAPAATKPDLIILKAQLRDIDSEFQKRNSGGAMASGQAN